MSECKCFYCESTFENFQELANHINTKHKEKHNKWALKFQYRDVLFEQKNPFEGRVPLTDQEKENKEESQRILSGEVSTVLTQCPSCREKSRQIIPTEYVESIFAWRTKNFLMINCQNCQRSKRFSKFNY